MQTYIHIYVEREKEFKKKDLFIYFLPTALIHNSLYLTTLHSTNNSLLRIGKNFTLKSFSVFLNC